MALRTSENSHPSQISTPLQEPTYYSVIPDKPLDSMISDMSYFIDIPEEVLFQDYLNPTWMWTHLNDDS